MSEGGVICAGTLITDYVVLVDHWPLENCLSNISCQTKTGGGGPYNIIRDLRFMDANLPLSIAGLVGNDDNGQWLINQCKDANIDVNQVQITNDETPTSYTYVITVESTGRRTFFNQRGTNALLSDRHFSFDYLVKEKHYSIFYLGYITLLDRLDQILDNETVAGRVLKKAKDSGLETVVDFVSVDRPNYSQIAELTLPYVDHLIINEIELGYILKSRFQQATIREIVQAARFVLETFRVQRTVTIHFDHGAICISRDDSNRIEEFYQGSLVLPNGFIKGAVGAGDAFAAGVIYGIYQKWSIQERLRCGVCVAAMCLTDVTPSCGVKTIEQCLNLKDKYSFRILDETSCLNDHTN